jgi:hypothetical protein
MKALLAFIALLSLAAPAASDEPRINVDKLPIDIQRITKDLKSASFREERDGLRLRSFLSISAPAPPLNIVIAADGRDGWLVGPVPHTAPTHREFMEFVTPREWRPAVPDISALVRWLAEKAKN